MSSNSLRVALITGSGQGLGASIAEKLAADGFLVAVSDIVVERAETTAEAIRAKGGAAAAYRLDVTNSDEVDATIDQIVAEHGTLDALVCNAGMTRDNLLFKMSNEDWNLVIGTHLTGTFLCCRAAQRHMVKQRYGRIVLVSSRAAQGNRGQTNYSAAKAGLQGMARTMAIELGPFGVTVNAVAPGHIETAMTHSTAERMGLPYEELAQTVIDRNAIKRVGQPADVSNAVSYFLSEGAGYITGQVLYITGRPLG
jgi:3-oxoacyl-[acyl-carrier protein] reductase